MGATYVVSQTRWTGENLSGCERLKPLTIYLPGLHIYLIKFGNGIEYRFPVVPDRSQLIFLAAH